MALGKKARDGTLSIDEMAGGTFTISNGGVYGSLLSTPIINPPQSAILGMHSIQMRPMVVGKEILARPMMYIALTYDHRLIDGREVRPQYSTPIFRAFLGVRLGDRLICSCVLCVLCCSLLVPQLLPLHCDAACPMRFITSHSLVTVARHLVCSGLGGRKHSSMRNTSKNKTHTRAKSVQRIMRTPGC